MANNDKIKKGTDMSTQSMISTELRESVLSWANEPMVCKVDKEAIRKFATVLGDGNPLWTNEAYALKSRHGGLVAMPTYMSCLNPFHHGVAKPAAYANFPVRASAGDEAQFYNPIRPGDVITVTERFIDLYEKSGKKGKILYFVDERTYTNQKGELVGRTHWTGAGWNRPVDAKEKSPTLLLEPPPRFHEYVRQRPLEFEIKATFPSQRQIFFEDVHLGMEIPPLVRNLSHELFVRYAACTNDFSRHHLDYIYAAATGWKDCLIHGAMGACFLSKLMTDWVGDKGILRRWKATYRLPGYPGDTWTLKGKVTKKYEDNGENKVDCDIWIENQDGAIVTPGSATVALPSK
jgi:acyl dehydratase